EPAARLGVAQALSLLGQRQRAERLPRREVVEWQLALERQHDVEPAAVHLGEHPPARGRGLVEQLHVAAPHRGRLQAAEHAPRDGPPGLDREVAQANSKIPAFISPITPPSRRTSPHVASRLATGRPSGVSWIGEREVVKPIAPARIASRSSRSIARRSSSVAACSNARSPITWVRRAQWPR